MDILNFIKDSRVVAHNYSFDWNILLGAFKKVDIWLPKFQYVCTQNLAKSLRLPEKLEDLQATLNMKKSNHDAFKDA